MGRVDEGSALWIDGDVRQRDRVAFEKSKGLETMIDRLKGEPLFGYVHLVKSERSATARLADKLNLVEYMGNSSTYMVEEFFVLSGGD
jgi:PhoH-like ATPase